jgi:hypothetical protein
MSKARALNGTGHAMNQNHDEGAAPQVADIRFELTWKNLTAAATSIVAAVSALGAAGWLVLPAKQSEMVEVQRQLVTVNKQLVDTQEGVRQLTLAVKDLSDVVKLIKVSVPQPKAKVRTPKYD